MNKRLFLLIGFSACLVSFSTYGMGPGGGPTGSGVGSGPGARGPTGGMGPGGYQGGQGPERGQSGGNQSNGGRGAGGPGAAGAPGQGGGRFSFRDLDRNGDGYISRSEARTDPTLDQNFNRYDRENTGRLTPSEFQQFERDRDRLRQSAPGAGTGTPSGGNAR